MVCPRQTQACYKDSKACDALYALLSLQIAIHAIGDQANDDILAMYQSARRNNSHVAEPQRHRIEHAQHLSGAGAVAAFSQQQTVAVVNPLHLLSDMHIMTDRLGPDRSAEDRAFAYAAMLKVCNRALPWSLAVLHEAQGYEKGL